MIVTLSRLPKSFYRKVTAGSNGKVAGRDKSRGIKGENETSTSDGDKREDECWKLKVR